MGAVDLCDESDAQPDPNDALFPHYTSLATLRLRAIPAAVDYERQFSSEPSRTIAPGAFTQPPVMAASKRTKASRKTRARVRSDEENGRWRVRRGRKVYISKGREMTGAQAYSAYKKHATARA